MIIIITILYAVGMIAGLCITLFGWCLGGKAEITWELIRYLLASFLWPVVVPILCIWFIISFLRG